VSAFAVVEEKLVTVKVAAMQHAALINPDMRTPQPKSRLLKRCWNIIGYTIPPGDR
jgi:hypothetical protein